MKELEIKSSVDTVVEVKKQAPTELKYIGSAKTIPGHIVFEVNLLERTIKKAEFVKTDVDFRDKKIVKRINVKKNCTYISALNEKNVRKKLSKQGIPSDIFNYITQ